MASLPEPALKRRRKEQPEESRVKMDDLPDLPFEKILSYLSLEDRLRSRAVSRRWYRKITSFKPTSLFFSRSSKGFILGKSRSLSGAFAQNLISSTRFEAFFNTFGQSIFSNLKHLRLYDLHLKAGSRRMLMRILNSFGQLEELDLFYFDTQNRSDPRIEFTLNLPMLHSVHLVFLPAIKRLTMDAPRLKRVKVLNLFSEVELVHAESVERLIIDYLWHLPMNKLKNLKYLYTNSYLNMDTTLLADLEQLEQIHLNLREDVLTIIEQKQRYGRADLEIFYFGCRLSGPQDPAIQTYPNFYDDEAFRHLAENPSRLADEIPFWNRIHYSAIERAAPGSEATVLSRMTELNRIIVHEPIRDTERFLAILKSLEHIEELRFVCAQPQELLDRLPEHSTLQDLAIDEAISDFGFLVRFKHLIRLYLTGPIDADSFRKILEELPFLSVFQLNNIGKGVAIKIEHPKFFRLTINRVRKEASDVNSVVRLVFGNES